MRYPGLVSCDDSLNTSSPCSLNWVNDLSAHPNHHAFVVFSKEFWEQSRAQFSNIQVFSHNFVEPRELEKTLVSFVTVNLMSS